MTSSEVIDETAGEGWVGKSLLRREDAALLMGAGRYADDAPIAVGTLHAAIVRSPEAHATIKSIDTSSGPRLPGVRKVITGEEVRALTKPFLVVLKQPIDQWGLAVERVRYVGEAVALVLADDRYLAEDAAELVDVEYERLEAGYRSAEGGAGRCHPASPPSGLQRAFLPRLSPTAIRMPNSRQLNTRSS